MLVRDSSPQNSLDADRPTAISRQSATPLAPLAMSLLTSSAIFDQAGSTIGNAYNLGTISNVTRTIRDFVGTSDLSDLYAFQFASSSRTQISLSELSGDADIRLIQDANNNGKIESNEVLRVSALAGTNTDRISLPSLIDGNYYLEVLSYRGDTHYRLDISATPTLDVGGTIATATELGIIAGKLGRSGSVDSGTDLADIYQFRTLTDGDIQVDLTGLTRDADILLIQDTNNNQLIDATDTIARSVRAGTVADQILVNNLRSGTYFVEVREYGGQSAYTLNITTDSAGESLTTARNLVNLAGTTTTVQEFVGAGDTDDYYRFYLNSTSNIDITLRNLTADADLMLIRDINNNGLLDSLSEIVDLSLNLGTQSDRITANNLSAGTYFISVNSLYRLDTNYTLDLLTTPTITNRSFAGTLAADRFTINPGTMQTVISGNGNVDFGRGLYDRLDLSTIASNSVRSFNLIGRSGSTGVAFDPGNGTRLFDSITLNNGQEVLFEGIDRIEFADRNLDLFVAPNDPLFSQQWNLHMMGVPNAWRFTQGSTQVLIGIEDTGLGFDRSGVLHPDLNAPRTYWLNNANIADDFFREVRDEYYGPRMDSHGTSVQSVIASTSNNGIDLSGINWNSATIAVDVLDGNLGDISTTRATRQLIEQAIAQGQRLVINFSLGGGLPDPEFVNLVAQYQDQVLFIAAAGNDNQNALDYPAGLARSFDNVVAVGGVWGRQNQRRQVTQPGSRYDYGYDNGSNYGNGLTLMGPTEVIAAAAIRSGQDTRFGIDATFGGTSAATANVTGVASLIWSANPNLTGRQVSAIMQDTAYDLGTPGYDSLNGSGFVNADAGVRRALAIGAGYA
jgi:serine protease